MFIELVEVLRCIREHDESWLVASIDEMRDRSIRAGTLGCPMCGAWYAIVDGVADFAEGKALVPTGAGTYDPTDVAMRAGGLLDLGESSGIVVLGGSWAIGAAPLTSATNVRVIAVNPPQAVDEGASIALVRAGDVLPVGEASCVGIAIDESFGETALASALRRLAPGGRIVAPLRLAPPPSVSVLARDDRWWVGEKAPEVISLRRGSR